MSENLNPKPHRRAAFVATTILIGGVTASVSGNLAAINLGANAPGIGAYISAVFWPLALFGAIELSLHTPWARSWRDALTRWAGIGTVGALALYISYGHLAHVLASFGYDVASAHLGPVAIDGIMAMATLALNRIGQARRGHVASAPEIVAAPTLAKPVALATPVVTIPGPADLAMDDLATDWANLETEIAEWTAQEQASPVSPAPSGAARLTKVPAKAAELIEAATLAGEAGAAIDLRLTEESIAPSVRTARRWRAALKNGTARVS